MLLCGYQLVSVSQYVIMCCHLTVDKVGLGTGQGSYTVVLLVSLLGYHIRLPNLWCQAKPG